MIIPYPITTKRKEEGKMKGRYFNCKGEMAKSLKHIWLQSAKARISRTAQLTNLIITRNYLTIKYHSEQPCVAQVNLSSPPVNSLGKDFFKSIVRAVHEIESNPDITAMVISSECRVFSAGLDLKFLYGSSNTELAEFWGLFQTVLRCLHNSRLLTVAAINGHAIAGGCILTLCCDKRFMSEKSVIGLNETTFGLIPPSYAEKRMIELVGRRAAESGLTFGTLYTPQEALGIGLVDHVCLPGESVEDYSIQWAHKKNLPSGDIAGRATMKAILRNALDKELFGTEQLRQADIELFVNRIQKQEMQARLGAYITSLSAGKSKKK